MLPQKNESSMPGESIDDQLTTLKNEAIHNAHNALDKLHELEKKYRLFADIPTVIKILETILEIFFNSKIKQWNLINEEIQFLSKRRFQSNVAIKGMIKHCMTLLAKCPEKEDEEQKINIVETLRNVARGNFSLVIEYAKLTKICSDYKKQQNNLVEAAQKSESSMPAESIDEQLTTLKNEAIHNAHNALDKLHELEKKYRLIVDIPTVIKILETILEIFFNSKIKQWNLINEEIQLLSKRRLQSNVAIKCMIKHCMTLLAKCPEKEDEEQKITIVETLRNVARGKLSLEIEYAKLTKICSDYKKQQNNLVEAAKILNEIEVETLCEMDKFERIDFVLEQILINLLSNNMIKAQILVNKINPNVFANDANNSLKFKYYGVRIQMEHETNFLETSRHYQAILNSSEIRTTNKRKKILVYSVLYCVIHQYDAEKYNMMECLAKNEFINEIPMFAKLLLDMFLSKELIVLKQFYAIYKDDLEKWFKLTNKHGIQCWRELITRTIEHNIRIVSMYYTQIHMDRLTELLNIRSVDGCEEMLLKMIGDKMIKAKIDRPNKIVKFTQMHSTEVEKLNNFVDTVNLIMKKIQNTTHLIHKEMMSLNLTTEAEEQ